MPRSLLYVGYDGEDEDDEHLGFSPVQYDLWMDLCQRATETTNLRQIVFVYDGDWTISPTIIPQSELKRRDNAVST